MKANKLNINAAKSSALDIGTQGAKTATQKPKILCDGHPIAVNSNVKYLGLWITKTSTLTFISNLLNVKSSTQWVYSINSHAISPKLFCSSIMH